MSKKRIGVMGGTFDPIHHGHLVTASEVQSRLGLDEVIFVPAGVPSHKLGKKITPAEERYLMTVVATASNPTFSVSRVDIDRGRPTYTFDTLTDLKELYPDAELFFITGADVIVEIPRWESSQGLFELATFVGCSRPGWQLPRQAVEGLPIDRVEFVTVPALAISSTDVRLRALSGEPVWYLVPDGVVQFINKHGLYRD